MTRQPILICYSKGSDTTSPGIDDAIKAFGPYWHHLRHVWIVLSIRSPEEIRSVLQPRLGPGDKLLVVRMGLAAAWSGFSPSGSKWLGDVLPRAAKRISNQP